MYKKPTQQQPSNVLNKKSTKSTDRPPTLPDKKNDTINDFRTKDEHLLTLVKQHLQFSGYLRSYQILRAQKPNLKAKVQVGVHQNRPQFDKNAILQSYEKGLRQQFFRATNKWWNSSDELIKRLEFDLQVYFCIYNIHPNLRRQASMDQSSSNAFKKYLDAKGADLALTKQELALFAMPYMPKPQQNVALAYLFTKDWLSKIKTRLVQFLTNQLKSSNMSQQSTGLRKLSSLQEIYYSHLNSSINSSRQEFKQNCNHSIQIESIKQQNSELRTIIDTYHKKFEDFAESSKQNLYQSNQKWFIFSRQIFSIAKKCVRQDKIKMLEKYNSFFVGNIEEMIEANEISLFDKNSYMYEDLSVAPDLSKQKIVMKKQEGAHNQSSCQLDFHKIRTLFLQANNKQKQIEILTVLKALKDRLNKNFNTIKRKEIIIEYSRGDICGINEENYIVQKRLLFDGSERIREFYAKLTEALTTTDVIGLQYLSKSKKLIQNLVGLFSSQRQESKCFRPVVGILQRLSFSKEPRAQMINLGIIPMIFKIFKNEGHQLSDFTLQFLTAMMMNLSLKRASKPDFQKHKGQLIGIVIEHMTSENNQVRDYINGSIFLLLTSKQIKAQALKQKLDVIVKELLQTREDQMCSQQYHYILKRLNGEDEDLVRDQDTDEEDQEGQIEEHQEYDDEEYGSLSESSSDCIEGEIEIAGGQEVLFKNYALLGPEAIREQILTRSVLDQTSKRLNNMTTSINRSRRMDNIFVSKGNATVLEPQLSGLLNRKK